MIDNARESNSLELWNQNQMIDSDRVTTEVNSMRDLRNLELKRDLSGENKEQKNQDFMCVGL